MGFDFTVAISPSATNIDRELQYVKSALLYADSVTLISPLAYFYYKLKACTKTMDERAVIKTFNMIIPLCKDIEPDAYKKGISAIKPFAKIVNDKQYRRIPNAYKREMREALVPFLLQCETILLSKIGDEQESELNKLIRSEKLKLYRFEHDLSDTDGLVPEFFRKLKDAVTGSYPLFDEASNQLIASAVKEQVISLSNVDRMKIVHAGVSDGLIQRLPSFEFASVDEILDIRKELDSSLARFRSKMFEYSESIQSMPWNEDFESESSMLYYKKVVPAVLEIDELTKENSFLKNLGYSFLSSENALNSLGSLALSVAAGGVVLAVSQAMSTNAAISMSGTAWAATKVAEAFRNYTEKEKEIKRKDLYFYYQTGKKLQKRLNHY